MPDFVSSLRSGTAPTLMARGCWYCQIPDLCRKQCAPPLAIFLGAFGARLGSPTKPMRSAEFHPGD
jgi:hypothetical protein